MLRLRSAWIAVIMIFAVLAVAVPLATAEVDVFCVNVGKGDAILIMTGDYTCLVDTGKKSARDAVEAAFEEFDIESLDAIFLTHTDNDHSGGLKWLKKFPVKAIYASAYCDDYSREEHPATVFAKKQDLEVQWLRAGDSVPLGNSGAVFNVLAPSSMIEGSEDDNSLVMMLESSDGRMLLTGDMEYEETMALLENGNDLKCDVLKVPQHGDKDACPYELAEACAAKYAIISTDSEEKPGTPSKRVLNDLEALDYEIYVTQDCDKGISIKMDRGTIKVEFA